MSRNPFKLTRLIESSIFEDRISISAYLVKNSEDEKEKEYEYFMDEAHITFHRGYPVSMEIITLNGNPVKNSKTIQIQNLEHIREEVLRRVADGTVAEARRVLGESIQKIQEYAELVPSVNVEDIINSFKMKDSSKVRDLMELYKIYASLIDRHFLKENCDTNYPKCMDLAIVTNPTYVFLSHIRGIISRMNSKVDQKLSDLVMQDMSANALNRIYNANLKQFLTDDLDSIKVDSVLAFSSRSFIENSLVPYTLLLKKDPSLVAKIIEKTNLKIHGKISGDLIEKLDIKENVHGTVFILNKLERTKVSLSEKSFSHELVGINYRIGEGTFNIGKVTPKFFSQSSELASPLTLGIVEEGITSEKAHIKDCYVLFDLDLLHYRVLKNDLTKDMNKMKLVSGEEFSKKIA